MKPGNRIPLSPLRIAAVYALLGGLWILFSDRVLSSMINDPALLTQSQTYKGWSFVVVTAGLLYWLINRYAYERRNREEAFGSVFERITDGFVALDKNWRYTYVNKKAAEIFTRKPEDLVGRHIWTEFPEGIDQPFYKAYHRAMREQTPVFLEEYYQPYDRWFENRIYPSMDGLSIYFTDITERKKMEIALKESEQYNRTLFESSVIGLALCRTDGSLVDINDAYARIIGRTVDETLKLTYWDITPEKYAAQEARQLESLKTTGSYGPYEKEYIHKDGHLVPVRLQGLFIERGGEWYIWSSVEDITERRRAERLLLSELQVLEMISRGAALPEVLEKIVVSIESSSHNTIASVLLLDPDGLHVHYGAAPNLPEAYNRALEGAAIGPSAGSCGTAAYRREPVIVSDIETDPLWADYRELARTFGLRACWSTPIMSSAGKVLGTFAMYYREPRSPREEDFTLIARATHIAGIAIESRRAEETLRRRKDELDAFFNVTLDLLCIADTDGNFKLLNAAWERTLGYTRDELMAKKFLDFVHPDDIAVTREAVSRLVSQQEVINFVNRYRCKDGAYRWIEWRSAPAGKLIYAAARDITERKQANEALQRNEQVLRLFVEHSPAAIAMFDHEMKYIVASRRFLIDYNLGEQHVVGRSHYEVFPDIPERWKEVHRRCLAGAVEKSEEESFPRADGKMDWVRWEIRPWYETQGKIGGIILFSEVITERKRAEEELRITNEELQAINRIVTATTTTTGVKEILEKVLDEALSITGLEGGTICLITPDEALDIAVHRATSEATIQDLTAHRVKIGECLCGECARDHKPLILWDRESVLTYSTREAQRGEDIRFHAAYPLIIGEKCLGVLCVFTRTDKKPAERSLKLLETATSQIAIAAQNAQLFEEVKAHAETLEKRVNERTLALRDSQKALTNIVEDLNQKTNELEQANTRLKELDRLKSLFIASMSHELRTPLNSVIGFSSILLHQWKGPLNDEQKLMLSTVLRSGKHLLALISDVIDVSKIEAGMIESHVEEFHIDDVIAEAVESLKKEATDKGLALEVEAVPLTMKADRRRLLQCVLNLLSNAVKFTERGSVRVSARKAEVGKLGSWEGEKKPTNLLPSYPPSFLPSTAEFVEISVEDTGIGIRQEDLPKLFQAFTRLDSPLRSTVLGTGLGLYLTKKLAGDILRGDITAASELGKGSRFTLYVPVGKEQP